jgi:serine/threonine protein kinase
MQNDIHPEEAKQPIQMDEATKAILRSDDVPREIDVRGRKCHPKEYKGEGFKGVVWKGKDEYGGDVAIKFTIHEDYMEKSYLEEAVRARSLGNSDYFARFIDSGITEIQWPNGGPRKFVVFVEQWVNGITLTKFLDLHGATPSFFLGYVNGMCSALGVLAAKCYRHDDLKPDNVMIEEPEEGDVSQETKVKVIDTGSMKSLFAPKRTPRDNQPWFREDDYRWFAEHLLLIRNVLFLRKPLSLHVARFIKEIDPLLDRMFEEDRGVALWAPGRVCMEFASAWTRAQAPAAKRPIMMNHTTRHLASDSE